MPNYTDKVWCYNEMTDDGGNVVIEKTEQQILDEYWDYWSGRMIEKFGTGDERITQENCIDDFVVVNWAWKKT